MGAQTSGADPTCDSSPAAGQDRPDKQPGQPGRRTAIEDCGEAREPLARGHVLVRRCHGRLRPVFWLGFVTPIVPDGPAFVYPSSYDSSERIRGKYRTPSINSIQIVLPPRMIRKRDTRCFMSRKSRQRPASLIIGDAIDNLQSASQLAWQLHVTGQYMAGQTLESISRLHMLLVLPRNLKPVKRENQRVPRRACSERRSLQAVPRMGQ